MSEIQTRLILTMKRTWAHLPVEVFALLGKSHRGRLTHSLRIAKASPNLLTSRFYRRSGIIADSYGMLKGDPGMSVEDRGIFGVIHIFVFLVVWELQNTYSRRISRKI